jgi:hypothetical protein
MEPTAADLPEDEVRANLAKLSEIARAAGLIGEDVDKTRPARLVIDGPLADGLAPMARVIRDNPNGEAEG